jgi:hypothetical protein
MQTHRRPPRGEQPLTQTAAILLITVARSRSGIWSEPLDDLRDSWRGARSPGWSAIYSALIRLTDSALIEYDPTTRRARITVAGSQRAHREAQRLARKGIVVKSSRNLEGKGGGTPSAAAS